MARDPLAPVLRIRQVAVDNAQRELATSLRQEADAEAAVKAAEARITQEGEHAADLGADDAVVEAYGRWLPSGRAAAAQARAIHDRAQAHVAVTRAALSAARAAAEAAANLQARRAAEQAAELERRSQHALDEIASRPREPQ